MPHDESYPTAHRYTLLAKHREAELVRDNNGQLGLIDYQDRSIYWLIKPSYYEGLNFLGEFPPNEIGIYRDASGKSVAFWLGSNATFVGLLEGKSALFRLVPKTTKWLATPNGLHQKNKQTNDWDTLLWHPQYKK